ncbi:MAG: hypothetical protein L6R41_004906 [Letrouitia leprolyta]|nr:MAG: hypothetical protein L6R41_004906 [Letrouitia leprolyta]
MATTSTTTDISYRVDTIVGDLRSDTLGESFAEGLRAPPPKDADVPLDDVVRDVARYERQDYYYLINLIRFRAARLAKFRVDANFWDLETEVAKISKASTYAKDFCQNCLGFQKTTEGKWERDKLLLPLAWNKEDLDTPNGPSVAVLGYNSFLQDRVSLDDWFTLYIATVPCIYVSMIDCKACHSCFHADLDWSQGYAVIANDILNKQTTKTGIWGNSEYKMKSNTDPDVRDGFPQLLGFAEQRLDVLQQAFK